MSITATRSLPYPSARNASLALTSTETLATRPKWVVLLLFTVSCGCPTSMRNLPSWVNLRMNESIVPAGQSLVPDGGQVPLPPIQTLSLSSIEIPWLDDGQSYPLAGPPHALTRFPAGSNSSTGGAGTQHSLSGGLAAAPISVRASNVSLRCTMKM